MKLLDYFSGGRGRCSRVARAVGQQAGYLSQIANGLRPAPAHLVPQIVKACDGEVRHWDLRQDWHLIWPDLIGVDGAPAVPAQAEKAAA